MTTENTVDTPSLEMLKALLLNDPKDKVITGDEVAFHDNPRDKRIVLPQGFGFAQTISVLQRKQDEQEQPTHFTHFFRYRYPDGAVAMTEVLKARYGLTLARGQRTMFGEAPAETLEVTVGPGQTRTCVWGTIEIPTLDGASIELAASGHRQWGPIFAARFTGPRKHQDEVKALFEAVEERLKLHSIYRGHALVGANDLEFIDLRGFDRRQVVFSDNVNDQVENLLFGPLRNSQFYRDEGIPLKRTILLHGPFGTGKTSVAMITAQEAEANGWTYLTARPGEDVSDVLRTATLYQPAVVVVEDIETQTSSSDPRAVSQLLDAFDGTVSKGVEVIMVLTTNHIEKIHKGMLRPGRIDATIEIAELDRGGIERLIKAVVNPMRLADDVDYDAVYEQMPGFLPAFAKCAIDRAKTWAVNRSGRDYVLGTADLAGAAMSLHDQLAHMQEAGEGTVPPKLETAMRDVITSSMEQMSLVDDDGDRMYHLAR